MPGPIYFDLFNSELERIYFLALRPVIFQRRFHESDNIVHYFKTTTIENGKGTKNSDVIDAVVDM